MGFGSVHFGKKREKRLGDGNACGTEILDARFTYVADALDSGVALSEERLDRFRGLLLFSGGKVHADFIQNAHFPGGVRQIPGFVAVLLPTVADAHDRTLKNKGEVKDDAREVGDHDARARERRKAVGIAVPFDVVVARQFLLQAFH